MTRPRRIRGALASCSQQVMVETLMTFVELLSTFLSNQPRAKSCSYNLAYGANASGADSGM